MGKFQKGQPKPPGSGRKKGSKNKGPTRVSDINSEYRMPEYGTPVVYLVNAVGTNIYKVGYSTNLTDRVAAIKSLSPLPIKLIHHIVADRTLEKKIHMHFEYCRSHFEWFNLNPSDVDYIKSISSETEYDINRIGLFA